MGVELDKELMSKMTLQERFDYINEIKRLKMFAQNPKQRNDEWVDRDENEWDSSSGGDKLNRRGGEYNDVGDDSNEY